MKTKEKGASALKRALIGCVLLLCLYAPNCASSYGEIICDCQTKNCECFIQLGDEGVAVKEIIVRLQDQGYLPEYKGRVYDEVVQEAVITFQSMHGLQETGVMDDETLTMLIWGMDGVPKDKERAVVYVPTDGGIKYHNNSECSNMYDPRKMTICNAEELGLGECHAVIAPKCEAWAEWLKTNSRKQQ